MGKFTIENGTYGKKMVLCCKLTENIAEYCAENDIVELELNWSRGFRGDLKPLEKMTYLLGFDIFDYTIENISEIQCLKKLRSLSVSTYCKTPIDLNVFENLVKLSLFWRKGVAGLESLKKLKSLFISGYSPMSRDLSQLAQIKTLEKLSLKAAAIKSVGNIEMLQNLKSLGIYSATELENIDGIRTLVNLKELEIEGCGKIGSIAAVGELAGLEKLSVSNCKRIISLKPVEKLKRLTELRFIESTNIVDGEIAFVKKLPKIKKVIFQNRKHYDLLMNEPV
jgi:Leucine-rich repeat (LRR) protein